MPQQEDAGELDQRVQVQQPMAEVDPSYGQRKDVYVTVSYRWAKVESLNSKDLWFAQAAQSKATHRVKMRLDRSFQPSWRLLWRGRALNLDGLPLIPDQRGPYMFLMCQEQVLAEESSA
jgi:SPP1 family predicted phage head-tail adaptor